MSESESTPPSGGDRGDADRSTAAQIHTLGNAAQIHALDPGALLALDSGATGEAGAEPGAPAMASLCGAGEDAAAELLDWGSIEDEDGAFGQLSEGGRNEDSPTETEEIQKTGERQATTVELHLVYDGAAAITAPIPQPTAGGERTSPDPAKERPILGMPLTASADTPDHATSAARQAAQGEICDNIADLPEKMAWPAGQSSTSANPRGGEAGYGPGVAAGRRRPRPRPALRCHKRTCNLCGGRGHARHRRIKGTRETFTKSFRCV